MSDTTDKRRSKVQRDKDDVVHEAQKRFKQCEDWESTARSNFKEDIRFKNGDAYNNDQWPSDILRGRQRAGSPRPCLTFNKIAQHNGHIINSARQNQMGVKVNATGFGATSEAAEAIEGLIRHIEYQSNAQQNAYLAAIKPQIDGGIGWWHIESDWAPGDTFDQELYIRSVPDPLTVWSDPDCQEPDHSDMRWAMIGIDMPRKEFESKYPSHKDLAGVQPSFGMTETYQHEWSTRDKVRVMRYYRRNETNDTLYSVPQMTLPGPMDEDGNPVMQPDPADASGNPILDPTTGQPAPAQPMPGQSIPGGIMRKSEMPDELVEIAEEMEFQSRPITGHEVEYFVIAGHEVIEQGDTVFDHIPLVPVLGEEVVFEGRLDRKGQTRALIDAQRMYNYSASSYVEFVALQTKAPWMGDVRAFEGYEEQWASANTANPAYLPINTMDENTGPIPPPQRIEPPQVNAAHVQGMATAEHQMQLVSGQYDAEMGAQSNERTGTAIQQRQRQGETATYHFTDAQGAALRLTGKILIGAIPKVYDTPRAIQILGADGTRKAAVVDPSLPTAHASVPPPGSNDPDHEDAILAVNPTVGRYDVEADVGPAYGTRRQEAFNAIQQILTAAPALVEKVGDLLFQAADFPMADEMAERLAPPSQDPNVMALQHQLQMVQGELAQTKQQLQSKQADLQLRSADLQHNKVTDVMQFDLDRYKAETDRAAAFGSVDPEALRPIVMQLVAQMFAEGAPGVGGSPPMGPTSPAQLPAAPTSTAVPPMPGTNPPGGLIRAPVANVGSVQPPRPPMPAPNPAPAPIGAAQ